MSETTPPYVTAYLPAGQAGLPDQQAGDKSSRWLCSNCKHELAVIVNGEAWLHEKVILHRTLRASVICPKCGAANRWEWKP